MKLISEAYHGAELQELSGQIGVVRLANALHSEERSKCMANRLRYCSLWRGEDGAGGERENERERARERGKATPKPKHA